MTSYELYAAAALAGFLATPGADSMTQKEIATLAHAYAKKMVELSPTKEFA